MKISFGWPHVFRLWEPHWHAHAKTLRSHASGQIVTFLPACKPLEIVGNYLSNLPFRTSLDVADSWLDICRILESTPLCNHGDPWPIMSWSKIIFTLLHLHSKSTNIETTLEYWDNSYVLCPQCPQLSAGRHCYQGARLGPLQSIKPYGACHAATSSAIKGSVGQRNTKISMTPWILPLGKCVKNPGDFAALS